MAQWWCKTMSLDFFFFIEYIHELTGSFSQMKQPMMMMPVSVCMGVKIESSLIHALMTRDAPHKRSSYQPTPQPRHPDQF
jgi:hypothetical protein